MKTAAEPNALIHSSSPYLLQHAYNPVKWYPWGKEALDKAKSENKLLLISIGYSACHWCHVMERESFENEEVASVMNKFFVCIKVDREERPDIDQIYMDAVQLMTGRGGWPLNCITLPDQRPIYGGTYFPRDQWQSVLVQIAAFFRNDPEKCNEYAAELTAGIRQVEIVKPKNTSESLEDIPFSDMLDRWSKQFDTTEGGNDRSPKFPMPDQFRYLLQHWYFFKDENCKTHLQLSLRKMAYGGIYDQLGGGFSRYSVDAYWKVPHFEKMLYDNAQLVTLYSEAWQAFKDPLYNDIVLETLTFIQRELTSPTGGFYSALDADSEGVEGLFYTWKKEELSEILGDHALLFSEYYNVNELGFWEDDRYIFLRNESDEIIAKRNNISVSGLRKSITVMKERLMERRATRVRPGLDDKIICSWNALMLKAFCDAYLAFGNETYLQSALTNSKFILENFVVHTNQLMHSCKDPVSGKNSKAIINGFLEDYVFTIEAFIRLYQVTMNEDNLQFASRLMQYCLKHFSDDSEVLFYFTSDQDEMLIARKMELQDNVIPASNAVMAQQLLQLGIHLENQEWINRSRKMVLLMKEDIVQNTPWFCRWAQVALQLTQSVSELIIVGAKADKKMLEWGSMYHPSVTVAGSMISSNLPLLRGRFVKNEDLFYYCKDKTCQLPVKSVDDILLMMSSN